MLGHGHPLDGDQGEEGQTSHGAPSPQPRRHHLGQAGVHGEDQPGMARLGF